MTQKQRIKEIIDYLKINDELSVNEATEILKASPATVRRDFNALIKSNLAGKTWGGITASGPPESDNMMLPVSFRETLFVEEKKKIAEKAASYIQDGDVIMVDGGTTTFFMTKFLATKNIKVITNSILIAFQIDKERQSKYGAEVFVTGGIIYPEAGLVVGPQSINNIKQYHANLAFLSVGGIEAEFATNSNQLVVETERSIIEQSEKVIMLADHSKFGKSSMCKMCKIEEVDILITNHHEKNQSILEKIKSKGVNMVEVP